MPFQLSEKLYLQTDFVGYTLVSNMLIYLPSHSFLYEFGYVAEVGYWSIILESISEGITGLLMYTEDLFQLIPIFK